MNIQQELEKVLASILTGEDGNDVKSVSCVIAKALEDLETVSPSQGGKFTVNSEVECIFEALKGKEITTSHSIISFDQSQVGDVSIQDIVNGAKITINFNFAADKGQKTANILTAPTPDIRVTVAPGWHVTAFGYTNAVFTINVANYSPVAVYISRGIYIITSNPCGIILPNGDFLTNEYQKPRELAPGRSFSLNVDPQEIKRYLHGSLVCAAARDDIGREYRSDEQEFKTALDILFREFIKD